MLHHQQHFDSIIFGTNQYKCRSLNISKPLKFIYNDTRNFFPEIVKGRSLGPRFLSSYQSDFVGHRNVDRVYPLQRANSDMVMKGRDKSPFRNWKIPESLITGRFPEVTKSEKIEIKSLEVKPKNWIDHENIQNKSPEKPSTKLSKYESELGDDRKSEQKSKLKSELPKEWTVSKILENASLNERRVILKSLFLSNAQVLKTSLRKALMPDANKKLKQWLNSSTNDEKTTAVQLFKRLLENPGLCTDDRMFIQHILEIIKLEEDYWLSKPPHPHFFSGSGEPKLKYINLQSPEARRQRWMYSTWSHLPPYKETEAYECTGSHYLQPNKPAPLTYKIHPELG